MNHKVRTRFLPATDTEGGRIAAYLLGKQETNRQPSITRGYDYSLDPAAAHLKVAEDLIEREFGDRALTMRLWYRHSTDTGYVFDDFFESVRDGEVGRVA